MKRSAFVGLLGSAAGGLVGMLLPRAAPVPDAPRCQPEVVFVPSDCVEVLSDVPRRPAPQPQRRSRLDPPRPEPEARDDLDEGMITAFERCADAEGHHVVVDCAVWPCVVGIAYGSRAAFDGQACREQLPPDLPTETGMLVLAEGRRVHWRMQYLSDAALIERWEDQAWSELGRARWHRMGDALRAAVEAP